MSNLRLAPTRKYFGFGSFDDYVVLKGGRVVGRILLHPQGPDGRAMVLVDHRNGLSAFSLQERLISDARTSDN
jgi:hypothetical protein